eukprot:9293113-Heterocapsa_arctica.AAC.1
MLAAAVLLTAAAKHAAAARLASLSTGLLTKPRLDHLRHYAACCGSGVGRRAGVEDVVTEVLNVVVVVVTIVVTSLSVKIVV